MAFFIFSLLGRYKSSKAGEKGTGVWGGLTIFIGAFNDEKDLSHIKADISVAILQRGYDSSTITTLPVSSAASRIDSSSRINSDNPSFHREYTNRSIKMISRYRLNNTNAM